MQDKTSIGISNILKKRLSKLKRKKTFEEYISSMVSYFEITKIEPDSVQDGLKIKSDIDRVIRIIKSIEKDSIIPMRNVINKIFLLISGELIPDTNIDIEEINQLIKKNEDLKMLYDDERKKNGLLEEKLNATNLNSNNDKKFLELKDLVDWLIADTNFRKSAQTNDLIISPETLLRFKERYNILK